MRNSHLLSIAPTGTISLAFADNASNGIEPAYSWYYTRKKREADGSMREYRVEDHAWRLWRARGGNAATLPPAFVNALEISALDHMRMQAAIQPYVDAAISKTVNVPEDYPFEDFETLYLEAWNAGLKGITTYRPNSVLGAVLSVDKADAPQDLDQSEPDRRIRIYRRAAGRRSRRCAGRTARSSPPARPRGPTWSRRPSSRFAVFVGHVENGEPHPFEVWVNGEQTPRGLAALAKNLSMDMRAQDPAWLKLKLDSLAQDPGRAAFGADAARRRTVPVAGAVSAFAKVVAATAAPRSASSTAPEGGPRSSMRCSRARSRSPASTAPSPGRSTS